MQFEVDKLHKEAAADRAQIVTLTEDIKQLHGGVALRDEQIGKLLKAVAGIFEPPSRNFTDFEHENST